MSTNKFDSIVNLEPGKYDYKIKARVTRLWRGATLTGEEFKSFNLLLLDEEKTRIHAFVPWSCAEDIFPQIAAGKVYSIKNFTVQFYKPTDIFRCLRNDKQLVFSKDTRIEDMEEKASRIPEDVFDFYDHSELKTLATQKVYLTDVVGIIKNHQTYRDVNTKRGTKQGHAKFTITDGNSTINVTFWDKFGLKFENDMMRTSEKPVIIIISCCRVGTWNEQVDISNVGATKYYLNFKHHSVSHLRKMLRNPEFAKQISESQKKKKTELLSLDDLKKVGKEYIESEVLTHVTINHVEQTPNWYYNTCTSCDREARLDNAFFICDHCNKIVPHPDKKYKLNVGASDETGGIQIVLQDRQVRTLIGKRARDLFDQEMQHVFPQTLKNILQQNYSIQLLIKEMNVIDRLHVYQATNICNNFVLPPDDANDSITQMQQSATQGSTSSYHLQGLSDINFQSTSNETSMRNK